MESGSTIISIAFMFSQIYLRLEDNVSPPEIEIGLNNAIEKKSFQVRSASAFYNLPPLILPSSTLSYFMPEQETCEFQFQMVIWKSKFLVFRSQ